MKNFFDILRKCSLFNDISDNDMIPLLNCLGAKVEHFNKKHTIVPEGIPAKNIGIVLSGAAQVVRSDYNGNRSIVSDIRPTEIFGEAFACAEEASTPVSIIAIENSEVMLIECSKIMNPCPHVCGFHQQLIFNMMKDLAQKNMMFLKKIEVVSKRTTRDKLITYLSLEAQKHGSACFEIPFNRQELADYLEVERSGLSVEISKLKNEGLITAEKNRFTLNLIEQHRQAL